MPETLVVEGLSSLVERLARLPADELIERLRNRTPIWLDITIDSH